MGGGISDDIENQRKSKMNVIAKRLQRAVLMGSILLIWASACFADNLQEKVILASPFSPLAMPMAYIVENNLLQSVAKEVDLVIWNTPDQLRAILTRGEADFVSIPSNVGAIFYNKGIPLRLLRVSVWGVFYIISADPDIKGIQDLRGQKIFIPFRGDQPDLIFRSIAVKQGLTPFTDFEIEYVSSPLDTTMSLLAGKAKHALMIEPGAALVILKAREKGLNFRRAVDIQEEWGRATGRGPRFPNAGVVATPRALKHPDLVAAFTKAYDEAVAWVKQNTGPAALMAAKHVQGVNAPAFEDALKYTIFESVSGNDARDDVEFMFSCFLEMNPESIGGKLPDARFYE